MTTHRSVDPAPRVGSRLVTLASRLGAARASIVAAVALLAVLGGTVAVVAEPLVEVPEVAVLADSARSPTPPASSAVPRLPDPVALAELADTATVDDDVALAAIAEDIGAVAVQPSPALGAPTPEQQIAKLENKLAKSEIKEGKVRDKYFLWQDKFNEADTDIAVLAGLVTQAQNDLAAAEALPANTPEEIAARKAALKLAKKGLKVANKEYKKATKRRKKATKKLAKLSSKIAFHQGKQVALLLSIEELDPGHGGIPVLQSEGAVGQLAFSWNAIPGAESYNVYYSTDPGVDLLTATFVEGATSPLVLPGLDPETTLYAVVVTVVAGKESDPSNEIGATTAPAPDAPSNLKASLDGFDVTLTWTSSAEDILQQTIYWADAPNVTRETGTAVVATSPHTLFGFTPGNYYFVVTVTDGIGESVESNEVSVTIDDEESVASNSQYDPPWADIAPTNVIRLDRNPQLSNAENGLALRSAVLSLQPGERLEVGGGTWSIAPKFSPAMTGTANAPIWVVAQAGQTPIITRPDANQNLMNPDVEYVCFRGLEFTGGSAGIKINASRHLWIDDCHIHHVGEAGIAANSADTEYLYITRNHIHDTSGYAEGMYLGANNGAHIMSNSVIALNHVHDTTNGLQGDGIEIKQGSWGNWVAENTIHDTKYPALLVYGTNGQPVNLIERNVLIGSQDNTLQVQGEAIVRNNLIMNGATGFHSGNHQGTVTQLTFVHNTIVNSNRAAYLSDWANKPGMVFANNAVYSNNSQSIYFNGSSNGVTVVGNVAFGSTVNTPAGGFADGSGLSDFANVSWNGNNSNCSPSAGSALLGAASANWATEVDLDGTQRQAPHAAGCQDA